MIKPDRRLPDTLAGPAAHPACSNQTCGRMTTADSLATRAKRGAGPAPPRAHPTYPLASHWRFSWPLSPRSGLPLGPQFPCRGPSHTWLPSSTTAQHKGLNTTSEPRRPKAGVCVPACALGAAWEIHQSAPPSLGGDTSRKQKQTTSDNHKLPPFKPVGPVRSLHSPQGSWGRAGCSAPEDIPKPLKRG